MRRSIAAANAVRLRRLLAAIGVAAVAAIATAAPASAHSGGGTPSTSNFESKITSVTPRIDGVKVRVIGLGDQLEVTNATDTDLIVVGYEDEPYLRIGPDGIYENARSAATYLNRNSTASADIPDEVDPEAAPRWRRAGDGVTARWHDHRSHWMGRGDPPTVLVKGRRAHLVTTWQVPMRLGTETFAVEGTLRWAPPPPSAVWLLAAAGIATVAAAAFWLSRSHRRAVLVAMLISAVLADVTHVLGLALAPNQIGPLLLRLAAASLYPAMGWASAAVAIWLLARNRPDVFYFTAWTGAAVLLLGGISEFNALTRSHLLFAWHPAIARAGVASSLGIGVALVATAGFMYVHRERRVAPTRTSG